MDSAGHDAESLRVSDCPRYECYLLAEGELVTLEMPVDSSMSRLLSGGPSSARRAALTLVKFRTTLAS